MKTANSRQSGFVAFICLDVMQTRWRPFGPNADWIYLLVVGILAVLGGLVTRYFTQFSCVLIGMLLGFTWSVVVLFTGLGGSFDPNSHMTLQIVMTFAGGAAVFFMEHLVLVLATANVGGFLIVIGVDLFARTGFVEVVNKCISSDPPKSSQIPGPAWGLLASAMILAMAGWFVQTRPSPPPQPSEWNPAYWMFGAARPSAPPPSWLKVPPNRDVSNAPPPPPPTLMSKVLSPFGLKW
jgi:hypothetical protein